MADEKQQELYIPRNAGDMITAGDWNEVQRKIKDDLISKVGDVQKALKEHEDKPLDASKLKGDMPERWTAELDKRYVKRDELKSGLGDYRRYFKQIVKENEPVVIEHNLERYPMATVFELCDLGLDKKNVPDDIQNPDAIKFLVYLGTSRDPVADNLKTGEIQWGDSFDSILKQHGIVPENDQLFDDVLNDLWNSIFDTKQDQDHFKYGSYGHSKYIQTQILDKSLTMEKLGGYRDNLMVAIRPRIIPTRRLTVPKPLPTVTKKELAAIQISQEENVDVDVFHISLNALEIRASKLVDLMVLLRT